MKLKFILAALASGALLTAAGNAGALPDKAQNFIKVCKGEMEKNIQKSAAQFDKLGEGVKDKFMTAAVQMCDCVAKEVDASKKITDADKEKIWAMKEFKRSAKPDISDASKAGFTEVGRTCSAKMRTVMMEVMKKAMEKMKKKKEQ